MNSRVEPLERIVVVVPVHDEERLLGSALAHIRPAMDRAENHKRLRTRLIVVLDACTDGSASIAASAAAADTRISVVTTDARCVGAARALGVAAATAGCPGPSLPRWWVANTDADTRVPPDWLELFAEAADAGADALVGTVEPDIAELGPARFAAWRSAYVRAECHPHIHGANLGVRASAYRDAGGFQPVPGNEDVGLVRALRACGATVRSSGEPQVVTSARLRGRTAHGFAGYLSSLPAPGGIGDAIACEETQFVDTVGHRP
ncbi:glycosyltransferase family 2 protein [Arthrobacter sp. JSM 101049]|uniref:glycosyltransferase n=1 Tax=Arthrobacter sp. JSM 101049 TaxID=929097 RepID=UPI0035687265